MKSKLFFAIIFGLLLALAMPRPGIWLLAWVALVPLFVALRGTSSRTGAVLGLVSGLVYFAIVLFWMTIFGSLPWILLSAAQAVFVAVFCALAVRLLPVRTGWAGFIAVPALWTAMQWVRALGPYGFTWGSLAHISAETLPVAQMASITGPWGIDFIVCAFNLAIADLLIVHDGRRRIAPAVIAGVVVLAIVSVGKVVSDGKLEEGNVRVAVVQGDIARGLRPAPADRISTAFQTYSDLSVAASMADPDIIVWPESALVMQLADPGWGTLVSALAARTGANYLVGAYDGVSDDPEAGYYNAAHFYNRSGDRTGVYHKVHLVPYGEFVPLRERLPWLKRYGIREQDVTAATDHVLLDSEFGKLGVSICFESTFSSISQKETRDGAVALFVITNDSWFGRSQAARQHMMMSRLRAIENRRYVVRAASTGISAIIDPYGRVMSQAGLFTQRVLFGTIKPLKGVTLYTRSGDYFAYLSALVCLIFLARGLFVGQELKHNRGNEE